MVCSPDDFQLAARENEYLGKVDWLWQQLSPAQRSKIVQSVTDETLRQGSDKHCFIAEAMNANRVTVSFRNHSLFKEILKLARTIFYDGPSYDLLLDRKLSVEDRKRLNDIYYARIGNREHQYQRATELVRAFVTNRLITI